MLLFKVHDNQIESIDNAIGTISGLQTLNCRFLYYLNKICKQIDLIFFFKSHNLLKELPNGLCELKRLVNFNSSNNRLVQLPKNFGHLDDLEDLVIHSFYNNFFQFFFYNCILRTYLTTL